MLDREVALLKCVLDASAFKELVAAIQDSNSLFIEMISCYRVLEELVKVLEVGFDGLKRDV